MRNAYMSPRITSITRKNSIIPVITLINKKYAPIPVIRGDIKSQQTTTLMGPLSVDRCPLTSKAPCNQLTKKTSRNFAPLRETDRPARQLYSVLCSLFSVLCTLITVLSSKFHSVK